MQHFLYLLIQLYLGCAFCTAFRLTEKLIHDSSSFLLYFVDQVTGNVHRYAWFCMSTMIETDIYLPLEWNLTVKDIHQMENFLEKHIKL
jgi:hypothetical protein